MSSYGYEWVATIAVLFGKVYDSPTVCDMLVQRLRRACVSTCRIRRNREWLISVLRTLPCAHSKANDLMGSSPLTLNSVWLTMNNA